MGKVTAVAQGTPPQFSQDRDKGAHPLKVVDDACIAKGTPTHILQAQHKTQCLAHT